MTTLEKILEDFPDHEFLIADGFDDCIVGVHYAENVDEFLLLYDSSKIITKVMLDNEWDYEQSLDHFYVNIKGAYMGTQTPMFIHSYQADVILPSKDDVWKWLETKNLHETEDAQGNPMYSITQMPALFEEFYKTFLKKD